MGCDFSACCIASGEPMQIRESISKMNVEIQKKIYAPLDTKRWALNDAFVHTYPCTEGQEN